MIKIFRNSRSEEVNIFLKKSKGVIKHYGEPIIVEYDENDFNDSDVITYFINGEIIAPKSKIKFNQITIPKIVGTKQITVFGKHEFEIPSDFYCSIIFETAKTIAKNKLGREIIPSDELDFIFENPPKGETSEATNINSYRLRRMLDFIECRYID